MINTAGTPSHFWEFKSDGQKISRTPNKDHSDSLALAAVAVQVCGPSLSDD